ncbi:piezo-type mechanosensitive ion channel component isoform X3 [Belonocnema kinseyi]|uniref:piezo-type mechanosensitive ion channel component isoform X3 n=1 Tax=Belonocnema kinseyi TaxID=2817044 RepID=UPI00143CD8DF|nr:piezo-type mechanosensitive ion channel component isoform X3 [Belonocnema kinseyi]
MGKYWLNVALVRIVLPVVLAGSAIWRPVGLSLVYLTLMFCSPMISIPTHKSMKGHTGRFLKACLCLSFLVALTQITFHIVLLALPPYGHFLQNCELLEKIFRHVGLVRLDDASVFEIVFWLAPEIVVLPTTLLVFFICRKLTKEPETGDDESPSIQQSTKKTEDRSAKVINFLGNIGTYVALASLCWAASFRPSVEGGFYFVVFLGAATWWACNKELLKGFAIVCRVVMFIVILHIITLLSYQNQWPQEFVPINSTWSRYFALSAIYTTNCSDPRDIEFSDDSDWLIYGYALRLVWLYYILALQSQFLARKPRQNVKQQSALATERTPLMRFGSGRTGLLQDSTGSVIVPDGQQDDSIQLQSLSEGIPEDKPGVIENIIMAVYSVFQLVVNSSYLATNIIMMTWSIMYHSWTTFALLMWALILWMVPNKRASMMKCSPFIVFYATVLLLIEYFYSMNLTSDELPDTIHGITIAEIGFSKPDQLSCWNLIVKCLFMSMFWITMRQYTAERKKQRRSSTLREMVAPLHVSVSTATTAMNQDSPEIKSKFMKDFGKILQQFLTKFWIAIVAIMLFTSGITGSRMTLFRIIYMMLFLLFVISFQISWRAWRRMMYGFWITVIGYSIIMLILVYTYQFKSFPSYWSYIGINKELQNDFGLETYETKDLFVRLLTPTFFVIITVLQIHYFHDDFLEITNIERLGESSSRRASLGYSPTTIPVVAPNQVFISENDEESTAYTLKQLKHMSKMERLAFFRKIVKHMYSFYNYVWLFFELHMQKIIFISLMLLCTNDVCAINFFFVLAIVIIINFSRNIQIMAINIIAATIALLMVTKMLYQIEYVHHEKWNVNCTRNYVENQTGVASNNTVYNIAEWIGMKKAAASELPDLLKGYIGIITVTTLRAIITVRQWFHRQTNGEPLDPPLVMFPKIARADADKGLVPCLKFLFNFGFYKFGVEFCMMAIVALIGTRLDFYSVLYSVWLIILFSLKRKTTSRLWPLFKVFVIVLLPIQYAVVVAPPTWFCIQYPWSTSEILRRLQEWMYLPDPDFPPNPKKLICDFILLLMIVRQSLVFRIEQRSISTGQEFIAGHNYSVYLDLDKPNFVNPVKDYVSHIHNWLDVLKRGCLMSLMWITLSIMFLAGTKRTNIFSLGYLIGAFVFLWQGSDFYLRPVKTILKWWNLLIGYNIIVIFSKALLQGVGCVLIKELESSACWLIQLLGIACLKKFQSSVSSLIPSADCQVPREDIGMVWDGLCFGFLLMQKRLFKSYYFFHIVDETKAMSILASRGAELLEELHQKRIVDQDNFEKAALQKLKFKMDKIKANQRKIQGPSYREPATHKIDSLYPALERPLYRERLPSSNREAVRSGDYYMFDDLDDDDVTDLIPDRDDQDEEERRRQQALRGRRMTVSELMTTLIKTDIEIATHVALYGGTTKDALRLRRQSAPLTRKKSSMSYLSARSDSDTAAATDAPDRASLDSAEVEQREKELKDADLSKSLDSSEAEEYDGRPKGKEGKDETGQKVSLFTYFKFLWAMLNSTMVSMTKYLNRFSSDYRYIRKVLAKEKKDLKAKPDFRMGMRLGISQIWQPIPIVHQSSPRNGSATESLDGPESSKPKNEAERKESSLTVPHIRILAPSLERGLDMSSSSSIYSKSAQVLKEEAELSEVDQPPIIQLAASIWFGILAHSTLLCYFMVFLHQIKNASILSTPLPLMVFFWGSLTVPRPSKTFWVTLIAYTEVIVIVKCIFQLELIPWNQSAAGNNPLFGPRIVGIERKQNYALWDLLLLLMVFFHRFMLKSLGQWTRPSIKSRKVIPSRLTMVAMVPEDKGQGEPSQIHIENEEKRTSIDLETPKGRKLSIQPEGASEEPHASTDDNHRVLAIQSEESDPLDEKFSKAMNMTTAKYLEPMRAFFRNILNPVGKEKTNVYAYMFFCDFFNFILIIFGFSAFGTQQGDGGVTAYLQENRVPMPFLLMLLLQFALIVIDRALFLRKSILGKLIFQYCLIFGIHIWMFFILPSVTERQFTDNYPPQIWYMVKCFYLLLAAYQLRLGYPTRILGNFLCKNYSMVNYFLFKGFMVVPLLFELRAVMDWIWTDTSMSIMDWFKMEDIYANIYQLKCMRGVEADYPQPRGQKKSQSSKYMVGGCGLFFMIGLVWFPLLFFALGRTVGVANLPSEVSLKISIGPYEPIYSMSAQDASIFPYTETDYNKLYDIYARDRSAVTFLENYVNTDVAAVRLSASSGKLWAISPPDRERLKMELESNSSVTVHVEWSVSRKTDVKDFSGISSTTRDIKLPAYVDGKPNPKRQQLVDMLSLGNSSNPNVNSSMLLRNAFPKFLKVTSRITDVVPQLMRSPRLTLPTDDEEEDPKKKRYLFRNITLQISSTDLECCAKQQWWVTEEDVDDPIYQILLKNVPLNDKKYIMMFLFNEKAFPESLSFISGVGILGMYSLFLYVISQLIRRGVSDVAPKIMFDDLPYVDRILRLCLDIYLVRESKDLCLEEDLFAKLIFLYRSPETLIRWTRPPNPSVRSGNEDDEDDDDVIANDDDDDNVNRPLHEGR